MQILQLFLTPFTLPEVSCHIKNSLIVACMQQCHRLSPFALHTQVDERRYKQKQFFQRLVNLSSCMFYNSNPVNILCHLFGNNSFKMSKRIIGRCLSLSKAASKRFCSRCIRPRIFKNVCFSLSVTSTLSLYS